MGQVAPARLMPFGYIILEDEASLPVDGGWGAHVNPAEGNPYFLCLDCLTARLRIYRYGHLRDATG